MAQRRIIAVDHGNRNIKTLNCVFPSGFMESGHLPSMGADTLIYKEKECTLVDQRMPQKNDKTKDEDNFMLTLFAIGKEVIRDKAIVAGALPGECIEVVLLVGLPPSHCKALGKKFVHYFKSREKPICFTFNGTPFAISFVDVHVYPQAYAAATTVLEQLKDVRTVNIVDIGGYTVDLLRLIDLRPDMSACTSLYHGANMLFQKINDQIRATGANNIPDAVIEGILMGDEKVLRDCSQERADMVRRNAKQGTKTMLQEIAQTGIDLTENRTVFVGGGSILLRSYIEKTGMVAKPLFVDNVHANAEGYQLLYNNRNATQSQGAEA